MPAIRNSPDKWFYENFIRNSGIPRTKNHSARKATVQKLCNSVIPDSTVLQVSGHRNVHCLNSYKKPSTEQQQSTSHLLSCYSAQPNPSTSNPISSSTYSSTITDITNQQSQNGSVIMPGCTLHSYTIQIIYSPCGPLTKKPKWTLHLLSF